ncbi:hypothetical protein QFC21_004945 [Naganishia friedmannii]|uniref:Uncharacterized protein n=1 Tax=Naganishia friedmannii TaxID=89922 RepID=A0ACC2VEK8_9TREE|nr:hypothetical protein QFC21_004945 [Naganishia friedmannii]
MSITVLTAADITTILADPSTLEQALASQRDVLAAFSRSSNAEKGNDPPEIQIPHRTTITTEGCTTLCMPSRVRGLEGQEGEQGTGIGVKVVSVPRDGDAGLPATTTLFEGKEGKLKAVVNARALTAVRNSCASALFILSLPTIRKSATSLVLFGSGAQAKYHALVLCALVPTIRTVTIVARRQTERLSSLVEDLRSSLASAETSEVTSASTARSVQSVIAPSSGDLANLISTADIICTMTSSTTPLFPGPVKANTAIVLIGSYKPTMHEISGSVLAQGMANGRKLIVDSREACLCEAGELIDAQVREEDVLELGQVLSGGSIGGQEEGGVFIFKSVGISVQDVAIADVMLRLAEARGLGIVIPDYD